MAPPKLPRIRINPLYLLMAMAFTEGLINFPRASMPLDFASFLYAGEAVGTSGLNPYSGLDVLNMNAPASLPLFQILSYLPRPAALPLWLVASISVYVGVVLHAARGQEDAPKRVLWALCAVPFWWTLFDGQIYGLLLPCAYFPWFLKLRPITGGLLMAPLVALKPNFVLLPLVALLNRERRLGLSALGGAAVLSLLPVVLYGPVVYGHWFTLIAMQRYLTLDWNASILSLVGDTLYPPAAGLIAASVLVTRSPAGAVLAAILAAPIGWFHYAVFLIPALLQARWEGLVKVAIAVLVVPAAFIGRAWPIGQVYALLFLALLAWELQRSAWRTVRPLKWFR